MDCEKFDRVMLDLLYDELDELTQAAAKRHMEHCTRCHRIFSGLRATREVGSLPVVSPPDSLEARILELEQRAHAALPFSQRVGRTISILASYAMRPQLAMAALLLLLIGSSLLIFRSRPSERAPAHVTERGVPENETEPVPITVEEPVALTSPEPTRTAAPTLEPEPQLDGRSASAAAPAAAGSVPSDASATPFEVATGKLKSGRYAEAQRQFETIETEGGPDAAAAALKAAEATQQLSGCASAVERFEQVSVRYASSPDVAQQATWAAAECHRALGHVEHARRNYELLLAAPAFQQRAQAALDGLSPSVALGGGSPKAAARAPTSSSASKPAPAKPKGDRGTRDLAIPDNAYR